MSFLSVVEFLTIFWFIDTCVFLCVKFVFRFTTWVDETANGWMRVQLQNTIKQIRFILYFIILHTFSNFTHFTKPLKSAKVFMTFVTSRIKYQKPHHLSSWSTFKPVSIMPRLSQGFWNIYDHKYWDRKSVRAFVIQCQDWFCSLRKWV